jgi:hypothetical protein
VFGLRAGWRAVRWERQGGRVDWRVGTVCAVGAESGACTWRYVPTDASDGRLRLVREVISRNCGGASRKSVLAVEGWSNWRASVEASRL